MTKIELTELNRESLKIIEKEIFSRHYDDIITPCLFLIQKHLFTDSDALREALYDLIEKVSLICDKTPQVVDSVIPKIPTLVNNSDEWIRTQALIILEKISKYRPNSLLDLMESIENCLVDSNKNVREISINTIGNLIINLHINRDTLFYSLIRMINDESWRIRVRSLEILKQIVKNGRMEKALLNKFIEMTANAVGDEDEEVQGIAIETLKELCSQIDADVFFKISSKIAFDEDWQVQEKGIWLVGEVGSKNYQNVELILPNLLNLLKSENLMVQTKVIDAFVKIGREYPDQIIPLIFENLTKEIDIINGLFEIFIYLGIERPDKVFQHIFMKLDSDKTVRKFVSDALTKLKDETEEKIEAEIGILFGKLSNTDWRIRYNTAKILGDINFILKDKSIAVWSYMKLKELISGDNSNHETDPEVIDAINVSLEKINNSTAGIDLIIKEISQEQSILYQQMVDLQNLPVKLRKNMLLIVEKKDLREASLSLEEEINKSIKRIEEFGNLIYNYQYKRLAVDLLEDWTYSRLDLLEQISDVKAFIMDKIDASREKYIEILKEKISLVSARIDILKSELEFLVDLNTQIKSLVMNGEEQEAKKKLEHLSYIRDKIYRLESEIGQIWLENLDFKDELKDITMYWVNVKIEAQQLLYTISYNLRDIQSYMDTQKVTKGSLKTEISFELLLNEFQNLVLQSTKNVKEQFERFTLITAPVMEEIKKGNFDNAENVLNLTISQTQGSIEDFNGQINKLYNQLDNLSEKDVDKSNVIRKYMDDWNAIKDSLIEKSNQFHQDTLNEIFFNRVNSILKIINPVSIQTLSEKLKTSEPDLLQMLYKMIETGKLQGSRIRDDKLYLPEKIPEYDRTLLISKKIEIVANRIYFMVRVQNTTKNFIHDLSVMFNCPDFLTIQQEGSSPKFFEISDFHPEQIQIFSWILKVKKPVDSQPQIMQKTPNLVPPQQIIQTMDGENIKYRLGEIRLLIRYKDILDTPRELDKRIDLLIR